jgi:hypothetical protein
MKLTPEEMTRQLDEQIARVRAAASPRDLAGERAKLIRMLEQAEGCLSEARQMLREIRAQ